MQDMFGGARFSIRVTSVSGRRQRRKECVGWRQVTGEENSKCDGEELGAGEHRVWLGFVANDSPDLVVLHRFTRECC